MIKPKCEECEACIKLKNELICGCDRSLKIDRWSELEKELMNKKCPLDWEEKEGK